MQITVEIAPETGARFAAEAERRGIPLDRLLSETLEHTAPERAAAPAEVSALSFTTEEQARRDAAVDAMLGFAKKHGFTTGGQDIKSMVHEGHKY